MLFDDEAEHPFLLDKIKQLGFYTDCLGKAHWSIPMNVIDEPLATNLVQTADILARNKEVTETEIELWIKHLGPVWKHSKESMEIALISWYQEMQECGLVDSGPNAMREFIFQGIKQETRQKDEDDGIN